MSRWRHNRLPGPIRLNRSAVDRSWLDRPGLETLFFRKKNGREIVQTRHCRPKSYETFSCRRSVRPRYRSAASSRQNIAARYETCLITAGQPYTPSPTRAAIKPARQWKYNPQGNIPRGDPPSPHQEANGGRPPVLPPRSGRGAAPRTPPSRPGGSPPPPPWGRPPPPPRNFSGLRRYPQREARRRLLCPRARESAAPLTPRLVRGPHTRSGRLYRRFRASAHLCKPVLRHFRPFLPPVTPPQPPTRPAIPPCLSGLSCKMLPLQLCFPLPFPPSGHPPFPTPSNNDLRQRGGRKGGTKAAAFSGAKRPPPHYVLQSSHFARQAGAAASLHALLAARRALRLAPGGSRGGWAAAGAGGWCHVRQPGGNCALTLPARHGPPACSPLGARRRAFSNVRKNRLETLPISGKKSPNSSNHWKKTPQTLPSSAPNPALLSSASPAFPPPLPISARKRPNLYNVFSRFLWPGNAWQKGAAPPGQEETRQPCCPTPASF